MAVKRSPMLWTAALTVIAVLVVAWIDAGEEPLRPISEPVELPENAQ